MGIGFKSAIISLLVYFLFYFLWGIQAGIDVLIPYLGINGVWYCVIGLSVFSCLFEWLKLKRLDLSANCVRSVRKRFLVFDCKLFYVSLIKNVLLTLLCYGVLLLLFEEVDSRYLTLIFLLFFLNINTIYQVVISEEAFNVLSALEQKRWLPCVSFIKKTQEGNVCYCTYIGLKNITKCIEL